jgi:hypothetical protein
MTAGLITHAIHSSADGNRPALSGGSHLYGLGYLLVLQQTGKTAVPIMCAAYLATGLDP